MYDNYIDKNQYMSIWLGSFHIWLGSQLSNRHKTGVTY